MATLDNLNFKVILDDVKFNEQVQADIKAAENLNVKLSSLLDIKKKLGNVSGGSVADVRANSTATRVLAENQEKVAQSKLKTAQEQAKLNRLQENGNKTLVSQHSIMRELTTLAAGYFSVAGVGSFISSLYRITGEFDMQKTALKAIIQDADKATVIFNQLKQTAIQSPYTLQQLTQYNKQLTAYSIPTDELLSTTNMLADVAAGLGVSMDRIVLAYGQVKSAAFLRGQEVRQFTESGIPILDILAKQLSTVEGRIVSVGEVFDKIAARQVTFDMVKQAFVDMTSEGGKFYNMQEVLSETLAGKIMKIKDYYQIMVNKMGEANSGVLKGSVDLLIGIMKHLDDIGRIVVTMASGFGSYATVLAVVAVRQKAAAFLEVAKSLLGIQRNAGLAAEAMRILGVTSKTAFYAGMLGVITAVAVGISQIVKSATELNRELKEIERSGAKEANALLSGFDALTNKLKSATIGSQNYRDAIRELNAKYGEYLPNLLTEKNALDEIKTSADLASEAIRNKAKISALEKGQSAITDKYGDRYAAGIDKLTIAIGANGRITKNNLTAQQSSAFAKYFGENQSALKSTSSTGKLYEAYLQYFGKKLVVDDDYSAVVESAAATVARVARDMKEEQSKLGNKLDILFTPSYSSDTQFKKESEIDKWYDDQLLKLNNLRLSAEDYNKAVHNLDEKKLSKTADMWQALGNTVKAGKIRDAIAGANLPMGGWQGKVNSAITANGMKKESSRGLWVGNDTNYFDYVGNLKQRYDEIKGQIGIAPDAETLNSLKQEKTVIEAITKALQLRASVVTSSSSSAKSPEQDAIESRIASLTKIKGLYDDLRPLVGDDTMKKILSQTFGQEVTDLNFDAQINTQIERLKKYDADSARRYGDSLSSSNGKSIVQQYKDSAEAMDKFDETLRDIAIHLKDVSGKGIQLDISKILEKQGETERKSEDDAKKRTQNLYASELEYKEKYGQEGWDKYLSAGLEAIKQAKDAEIAASRAVSQEKITDLSRSWVSERLSDMNVDLSNMDDKSITQVASMLESLKSLVDEDALSKLVPQSLVDKAKEVGLSFKDLLDSITKIINKKITDTDVELLKKTSSFAKSIGENANTIASNLEGISGEASGIFSAIGSMASSVGDITDAMSMKNSDGSLSNQGKISLIGTAISNISSLIGSIGGQIKKNKEIQRQWNQTVRDCEQAYTMLKLQQLDYEQQNLFGVESPYSKAISGMKQYTSALVELGDATSELEKNGKVQVGTSNKINMKSYLKDTGLGAGAGAAIGAFAGPVGALVGGVIGGVVGGISNVLFGKKKVAVYDDLVNKYEYVVKLTEDGYELNDKILADYDKMDNKTKKLIDNWKEIKDTANEALKQIKETISDLSGDIGDQLSTSLQNAFTNGNVYGAIDDFHNYITSTLESIFQQMAFSTAFGDLFDKLEKRMLQSFDPQSDKYDNDITDDLEEFDNSISSGIDMYNKTLDGIKKKFAEKGYDLFSGTSSDSSVSNSIQNVTEDTADLLASYINAIRSDVSYNKTQIAEIRSNLKLLVDYYSSVPTLAEYLISIETHTANIAVDTRNILSELKSVITTESGTPAFNVNM